MASFLSWITLATYDSKSSEEKTYRVKLNMMTGVIGCDCPAWVFKKNGGDARWCKHTAQTAKLLSCKPQRPLNNDKMKTAQLFLPTGDQQNG